MVCIAHASLKQCSSKQTSPSKDSRQSDIPPVSTSEYVEQETAAAVTAAIVAQAVAATTEQAEEPDQPASPETSRIEVTH